MLDLAWRELGKAGKGQGGTGESKEERKVRAKEAKREKSGKWLLFIANIWVPTQMPLLGVFVLASSKPNHSHLSGCAHKSEVE